MQPRLQSCRPHCIARPADAERVPNVHGARSNDELDQGAAGAGARGGPHAHVRCDRDRLRGRRRNGRARAHVAGTESPDARGGQETRHQQGTQIDGVALRAPAPWGDAARSGSADDERVHDSPAAVRRRIEVQQSPLEYPELERRGLLQEHRGGREGAPVHGNEIRLGACPRARRQDEHLGPARAPVVGLRLQGEEPRRIRRGLADLVRRHRAVLRPRGPVSRDLRRQGEPAASAGQPLPAAEPADESRGDVAQAPSKAWAA